MDKGYPTSLVVYDVLLCYGVWQLDIGIDIEVIHPHWVVVGVPSVKRYSAIETCCKVISYVLWYIHKTSLGELSKRSDQGRVFN